MRRKGKAAYPDHLPCVLCRQPFVGPATHTGTVGYRGGEILVPLHQHCAEAWTADPVGCARKIEEPLSLWLDGGTPVQKAKEQAAAVAAAVEPEPGTTPA